MRSVFQHVQRVFPHVILVVRVVLETLLHRQELRENRVPYGGILPQDFCRRIAVCQQQFLKFSVDPLHRNAPQQRCKPHCRRSCFRFQRKAIASGKAQPTENPQGIL